MQLVFQERQAIGYLLRVQLAPQVLLALAHSRLNEAASPGRRYIRWHLYSGEHHIWDFGTLAYGTLRHVDSKRHTTLAVREMAQIASQLRRLAAGTLVIVALGRVLAHLAILPFRMSRDGCVTVDPLRFHRYGLLLALFRIHGNRGHALLKFIQNDTVRILTGIVKIYDCRGTGSAQHAHIVTVEK